MEFTFRWFGPKDPAKINHIRQVGVTGIVTSLNHIKYGEKWIDDEIKKRKKIINEVKNSKELELKWSVAESLPVHNDIKSRSGKYKYYIDQYKDSLVNLSKNQIKTICYNFMPLIDWVRTDLNYKLKNNAIALKYDHLKMCAFEVIILKIKDAEKRYTKNQIIKAKEVFKKMKNSEKQSLKESLLGGLAANDRKFSINELKYEIDKFKEINHTDLRNNLKSFLIEIFPILKEHQIKYCIHPDDPPYNIFGLPRILSNENDIKYLTSIFKHENNGITLCTGSLGVDKKNNIERIIKKYGKYINFLHLRNIKRDTNSKNFYESDHLDGDVNMVNIIKLILKEERKRSKNNRSYNIPMRPDHGHTIIYDQDKKIIPGYSLLGRMKGLAELKGIIKALN